ncbi:MAG: HlyD family efflux transporter periplasmic adaptor subunit [Bacteroidales bacterium]|nr:HlyD family efflux transporter periplasmic adaptor subunit [Bacteroidales bacterium]
MDRKIEKKGIDKKYYWIGGISLIILLAFIKIIFGDSSSKLNIDTERITIREVIFDKYQDYISVNGTVEPIKTIYLDAIEGGRVEEILIEEGNMVKKGDVIIRLSNTNLLLEISNNEATVARAINDLKATQINLENQKIASETRILDLQYQLLKLKRTFEQYNSLIKSNHISKEEYEYASEQYELTVKQLELQKQKYHHDSLYMISRIRADEESIRRMQNNLELVRGRLDNLDIKAPVDGELATLNPEIGEVVNHGSRIGTINILDSYKMRVDIDEHYIARINRGLKGDFEFAADTHHLIITKVYPEVRSGTFVVDMEFTSDIPSQIRIGQTARIRLELGAAEDALLLAKGGFYQSTGGQWVYVVNESGNLAVKRDIRIGRQNPRYYEVLEGLQAGEKVIVSNYDNFGNMDKLILKNSE